MDGSPDRDRGAAAPLYATHRNLKFGRGLFQRGIAVKVLDGIATGEHIERSLILNLALALDDDKRCVILARRAEGQPIREIAVAVKVSVGVVHKTRNLAAAPGDS